MASDELPLPLVAQELAALASTRDAAAWIRRLHAAFYGRELPRAGGKFAVLDRVLRDSFELALQRQDGDGVDAFWRFMADVLVRIASSDTAQVKQKGKKAQSTAPLGFLVANALKLLVGGEDGDNHKRASLALGVSSSLRKFCEEELRVESSVDPKLLVEMMELFQISDLDRVLVRDAVNGLLVSKSHSAVIKLCVLCDGVEDQLPEIAKAMAQAKDWVSAELFTQKFDEANTKVLARILIETAIELRDFKRAHRLVDNAGLQDEYPGIDALYSQDGLARLIENRRWQLAITFVGSDPILQRILFKSMLAVNELHFASLLVNRIQAGDDQDEMKKILSEHLSTSGLSQVAEPSTPAGDYLSLSLNKNTVKFCDSDEGVQAAINHFFSDDMNTVAIPDNDTSLHIIGLDVEWKPVSSRSKSGQQPIASILQIASASAVFIIDLLELQDSNLLFNGLLKRLLSSSSHLKVGFNFESDLRVLRHTFPERSAFKEVTPFLDLTNAKNTDNEVVARKGLSNAAAQFLGKPLEKKMQLSDWEQRPLSSQQLEYAALDAFCLVQIVQVISSSSRRSWEQTAASITTLTHPCQLTHGLVLQLCANRVVHYESWKRRLATARLESTLVTPDELQDIWQQRMAESKSEQQHEEIALLPYDQMQRILKSQDSCDQIAKLCPVNSICMFAAEEPRVVCIDARRKLDMAKLAKVFRVGRRKVRLATSSECMAVFGFAPGTVAPFGHRPSGEDQASPPRKIKVFADLSLKKAKHLAAGSGVLDKVIWMRSASFFELIRIESVANVALQDPTDESTSEDSDTATTPELIVKAHNPFEYKFLADSMVSQVGRWLRTTGVDVVTWNPVDSDAKSHDPKRDMLAMAARESRIVLTRDTTLPSRRDAGACFVLSNDECFKQFREVKAQFGLHWRREDRASRCARCNSTRFSVVEAEFVRTQSKEKIQAKVLNNVSKYWSCDDCGKIYWEGPKYTPTGASTNAASDAAGICGVKYRPVARRPVHLIRKTPE